MGLEKIINLLNKLKIKYAKAKVLNKTEITILDRNIKIRVDGNQMIYIDDEGYYSLPINESTLTFLENILNAEE